MIEAMLPRIAQLRVMFEHMGATPEAMETVMGQLAGPGRTAEQSVALMDQILKMVQAGRYEAALPPGVYDVFVSEASSSPRCRRLAVNAGYQPTWRLMLEHDDIYLQK